MSAPAGEPGIRTVLGVRPAGAYQVLMHEHTIVGWAGSEHDPAAAPDREAALERVGAELAQVRERYGVELLVDAAPCDIGRDVAFDAELARRSGVDVVACTGLYKEGVGLPHYFELQDEAALGDFFERELTDGVGATGIRCGAIKVASGGAGLTAAERRVFRAAGAVSARTGAPILTHTDPEGWAERNVGLDQVGALVEGGADPARIAVGHACGTSNVQWLLDVCATGSFVAFDRIGSTHIVADEVRAAVVAALIAAGRGDQVLLSLDHQGVWRRRSVPPSAPPVKKDFGLVHREFLPRLRAAGIGDEQIGRLMTDNPQRLLTAVEGRPG